MTADRHKPDPARDCQQRAYAALERLLAEAAKSRTTGTGAVEIVFKEGGITAVQLVRKEIV